jgi:uncharacterized OB-fold protein
MSILNRPTVGVPVPRPTVLSKPFWDACASGELTFQRCGNCDKSVFPPEAACTRCLSPDLLWERSSGQGEIHTYTVIHRAQQPAFSTPYAVAIVELSEGWYISTNVVDLDDAEISVGLPVKVLFIDIGEGISLPTFHPDKGAS